MTAGQYQRNDLGPAATHHDVAAWYDAKFIEMGGAWRTPVEELDAHLWALGLPSDARGMRLVDLGCGDGQLVLRAVRTGAECYGVDLSNYALVKMSRDFTTLSRFDAGIGAVFGYRGPMESTGYHSDHFDFTLSLGSMEHALDVPAAVREMSRILKPGGRWLLYVPNEEWVHKDQPIETVAPSSWWIEQLEAAGLVVGNDEKMGDNSRLTGIKPRRDGGTL